MKGLEAGLAAPAAATGELEKAKGSTAALVGVPTAPKGSAAGLGAAGATAKGSTAAAGAAPHAVALLGAAAAVPSKLPHPGEPVPGMYLCVSVGVSY